MAGLGPAIHDYGSTRASRRRMWLRSKGVDGRASPAMTDEVHSAAVADNPGLKSQLPAILAEAYELGIAFAMDETDLERTAFPARCPYDWDEMMSRPIADAEP